MSQPGHYEIERMLTKYGEQRRAEAGTSLELHKAAREQLHAEVENHYGREFVSAQESAENFARTLAWQQNVGRWWHALVPKIGFAGACFAAVMVVFSIAHREAQDSAPGTESTSDFLDMTPLAEKEAPAIVPDAAQPLEDSGSAGSDAPPPPVTVAPALAPAPSAKPVTKAADASRKMEAATVMEPKPEPAEMLADDTTGAAPKPTPKPKIKSAALDAIVVAPPVWKKKEPGEITVNLPANLTAPATVVSTPSAPPAIAEPMGQADQLAAPVVRPSRLDAVPAAGPLRGLQSGAGAPPPTTSAAPASPGIYSGPMLRVGFAASHPHRLLQRFDAVLEKGTIAIRDQDGSIYRGPAGTAAAGAVEFTARGSNRTLKEAVTLKGRLVMGAAPGGYTLQADTLLGDGGRFRLEAVER